MQVRTIQIQLMSPSDYVGGGAFYARGIAQGLRSCGVTPTLLCTGSVEPNDPNYHRLDTHAPGVLPLLWRLDPLGALPSWIRAVRRSVQGVDAVISLSPVMAFATMFAAPRMPLIYAPATVDRVENPMTRHGPYQWLEAQCYRRADRVLLTGSAVREAVERLYMPLRQPIGECLFGIDVPHACRVERSRRDLDVPESAVLVLTVGLINENKGQRYIAEALAHCAKPNWHWAVVGEGTDEPTIRAVLSGSCMQSKTRFTGLDPRIADWYAAADILVASSRHETFGLAIAEAIAAGIPVVIPRNTPGVAMSPLAEAVERYGLGRTFERCHTESLIEMLTGLLSDPDQRYAIAARARAFSASNFDWARYARCAIKLLESKSDLSCPLREPVA